MITQEYLLTALVVVLLPGTGVLYTVATGLFVGRRASAFAAFGCTLGIVPSLLASVFGLAALFHTSVLAFQVVKYAGAAYLLYLAWGMWRSASTLNLQAQDANQSFTAIAVRGCLINTLNPKLSIFFLAFLPQFVPASAPQPLINMIVLGGVFMLLTLAVFVVYGLVTNRFSQWIVQSKKLSITLQKIFAGSFAALGLKLALTERS